MRESPNLRKYPIAPSKISISFWLVSTHPNGESIPIPGVGFCVDWRALNDLEMADFQADNPVVVVSKEPF